MGKILANVKKKMKNLFLKADYNIEEGSEIYQKYIVEKEMYLNESNENSTHIGDKGETIVKIATEHGPVIKRTFPIMHFNKNNYSVQSTSYQGVVNGTYLSFTEENFDNGDVIYVGVIQKNNNKFEQIEWANLPQEQYNLIMGLIMKHNNLSKEVTQSYTDLYFYK